MEIEKALQALTVNIFRKELAKVPRNLNALHLAIFELCIYREVTEPIQISEFFENNDKNLFPYTPILQFSSKFLMENSSFAIGGLGILKWQVIFNNFNLLENYIDTTRHSPPSEKSLFTSNNDEWGLKTYNENLRSILCGKEVLFNKLIGETTIQLTQFDKLSINENALVTILKNL